MRTPIAMIALVLLGAALQATTSAAAATPTHSAYVPGELLVRFEGGGENLVKLPEGVDLAAAQQALDGNPAVAYAVPNYVAHASAIPNDPGSAGFPGGWQRTQWNFLPCGSFCGEAPAEYQERGGLNAPAAWDLLRQRGAAGGKGTRVAVLDTGVAYMTRKPKFRKS